MGKDTSSIPRRQLSVIAILIVAIATPATMALSYYHLTGDPTFRPLALTVERLIAGGQMVKHIDVQAVITTDGSSEGARRSQHLGEQLAAAFYGKGLNSHVRLHPQRFAGPPQIFLYVDGNRLGPFSVGNAPQGVRIATEAVAIAKQANANSREHSW